MQGEEPQGTDVGRRSAAWRVLWAGRAWPPAGADPFSPSFPQDLVVFLDKLVRSPP